MGIVPKAYYHAFLVETGVVEKSIVVLFIISDKTRAVFFFESLEQLNGYFASLFEPITNLKLMSKKDFMAEIGKLKKKDDRVASMDLKPLMEKLV